MTTISVSKEALAAIFTRWAMESIMSDSAEMLWDHAIQQARVEGERMADLMWRELGAR